MRDELRRGAARAARRRRRARDGALWRWRDGVSIAVARARAAAKLSEDIAVPVDRLAEAIEGTLAIGARHGLEACSWGHAGDGNLHATFLLRPGRRRRARARRRGGERAVRAGAARSAGRSAASTASACSRRGQLAGSGRRRAVAAHRAIKRALDPKGLFNPGKKVP